MQNKIKSTHTKPWPHLLLWFRVTLSFGKTNKINIIRINAMTHAVWWFCYIIWGQDLRRAVWWRKRNVCSFEYWMKPAEGEDSTAFHISFITYFEFKNTTAELVLHSVVENILLRIMELVEFKPVCGVLTFKLHRICFSASCHISLTSPSHHWRWAMGRIYIAL